MVLLWTIGDDNVDGADSNDAEDTNDSDDRDNGIDSDEEVDGTGDDIGDDAVDGEMITVVAMVAMGMKETIKTTEP